MTTTKQIRTRCFNLRTLAADIAQRLPSAHRQLEDTLYLLDGYPATASGSDTNTHSHGELTSVEAAANARLGDLDARFHVYTPGPTQKLQRIDGLVNRATTALEELLTLADNNLPTEAREHLRCIGTGDHEGAACTSWASTSRDDGRCDDCGQHVEAEARAANAARMRVARSRR